MKWFGRKAGRVAARPFLLRGWPVAPVGESWPRGYEAQVREAYLANPVAQRAVRLVAEGVGAVTVYDGAAPAGAGLHSRSMTLVTAQLLETAAAQLLLHGNVFLQILCDADGAPAELFALRPERVSIEPDAAGWPTAYLYRAGEAKTRLGARDGLGRPSVVHLKAMHPLDDHYGLGCLGAAAGAVAIHNAATRWNKALLDNAARPSGALVYETGDGAALSADQYDRLKAEMEAGFQGAGNAGRPMLLEGGLKWQAMSLSPADMDFVGAKEAAARDIALAFGVPPMLLGLPGGAIDAGLHANVDHAITADPPSAPAEGQCWIVPAGAGGAWSGHENSLACWTSGGWRFFEPVPGMLVWHQASSHWIHWRGSSWSEGELPAARLTVGGLQVVGPRQPAVPSPSGGTTIDHEARAAIASLTAALKTHGLID